MRGKSLLVLIGVGALFGAWLLLRSSSGEPSLQGLAMVVDGDTIDVAGERVGIFGIDAPEQDQTCERGGGGTWRCGAEATRLMRRMAHYQIVECEVRAADVSGRRVARCRVGDEDLGRAMVRAGFAIEISQVGVYAAEEGVARTGRLGIWSGSFDNPKDWRDAHRVNVGD
jgi:endonuclease YncB( thermonuclease family)